MEEYWGDGRERLCNPPLEMLTIFVWKIEEEGGCGVVIEPKWPAQPWYVHLRAMAKRMVEMGPPECPGGLLEWNKGAKEKWNMVVAEISWNQVGRGHEGSLLDQSGDGDRGR